MGTTTERPLPQYLLADLPFVEDPLPLYATWRQTGPLLKGGPKQWLVTRHADVAPLLRDRRLTHVMPRPYLEFANGGSGPAADFRERSLLNRDGPDHTRLRRLMGQAFSGSLVRRLRDRVTELTDGLLTPLLDGQPFDVIADLAHPLPSLVICELLGIDHVDRDEVGRRAAELTAPGDLPRQNEALAWARHYLGAVLADRTPDPEGDLLQRMLAAEEGDDALSHEEIVDNAVLLFFAGFETTKHLIASGAVALNRFLRYDGPARVVSLVVVEPVTIGDRTIRPEQVLHLMLGSANHDEEVFAEPGVLDIGRHPNPHVSFGGGVHHCLGAMLARLEADVVFRRLAERVRSLEATEAPTFEPQTIGRYRRVPVAARAS
jgi:cytochrome P450